MCCAPLAAWGRTLGHSEIVTFADRSAVIWRVVGAHVSRH